MIFRKLFVSTLIFATKKIPSLHTAAASLINLESLVALIDEVGKLQFQGSQAHVKKVGKTLSPGQKFDCRQSSALNNVPPNSANTLLGSVSSTRTCPITVPRNRAYPLSSSSDNLQRNVKIGLGNSNFKLKKSSPPYHSYSWDAKRPCRLFQDLN